MYKITLVKSLSGRKPNQVATAKAVGELVAKRAIALKIENVVFDRGGYLYHGRVKALGDSMRANGMKI